MDFANVTPLIVIICYLVTEIFKRFLLKTDEKRKHLPLISMGVGIIAAIVIFFVCPDWMTHCANLADAIVSGFLSGSAAVGCNQLYKQFTKAFQTE